MVFTYHALLDNMWASTLPRKNGMLIWFNSRLCNYVNTECVEKGLPFAKDLFMYVINTLGLKCNFLEYESLKQKSLR